VPNIASVLKEEIARVARKEARAETEKLKRASVQYRSEIAALKRRVAELERGLSLTAKVARKNAGSQPLGEEVRQVRFGARGLHALRQRLELSAPALGRLLGVSAQTIYNWEAGTTLPGPEQIAAIAILRKAGKREISARLSELGR
jgi:DNA-binding transcriptional regulator YiaG